MYRAIDKHGTPVDFLLTAKRDLEAAKRFFRKALKDQPLLSPDRIGTDGAGAYPPAITAARKDGLLARTPLHYVTKHLQQGRPDGVYASLKWCSTPPLWHTKAVGGRPHGVIAGASRPEPVTLVQAGGCSPIRWKNGLTT